MKIALVVVAALLAAPAALADQAARPVQVATVCFKTGEQVSGMNKICYYNCLGSEAAITINSASLCPLSINR